MLITGEASTNSELRLCPALGTPSRNSQNTGFSLWHSSLLCYVPFHIYHPSVLSALCGRGPGTLGPAVVCNSEPGMLWPGCLENQIPWWLRMCKGGKTPLDLLRLCGRPEN